MPVTIRKLPGKNKYRVRHDKTISAFGTIKEKAEAQGKLLKGLAHGMKLRKKAK